MTGSGCVSEKVKKSAVFCSQFPKMDLEEMSNCTNNLTQLESRNNFT